MSGVACLRHLEFEASCQRLVSGVACLRHLEFEASCQRLVSGVACLRQLEFEASCWCLLEFWVLGFPALRQKVSGASCLGGLLGFGAVWLERRVE